MNEYGREACGERKRDNMTNLTTSVVGKQEGGGDGMALIIGNAPRAFRVAHGMNLRTPYARATRQRVMTWSSLNDIVVGWMVGLIFNKIPTTLLIL